MSLYDDEDKKIKKFNKELGLLDISSSKNDAQKYMNMAEDDIRSMSKEDCSVAQYVLTQYISYLQENLVAAKSELKNCETSFVSEVSRVYGSYDEYMPHNYKVANACNEYEHIMKAQDKINELKAICSNLENKINLVEGMIKIFHGLSFSRGNY